MTWLASSLECLLVIFVLSGLLAEGWAGQSIEQPSEAEAAFTEGRYREAAFLYRIRLARDPHRPDDHAQLIWSLYLDGERRLDAREALLKFRQAAEEALEMERRFPSLPESHFLVAFTHGVLAMKENGLRRLENARIAERSAQEALALNPDYAPAYVVLGIGYREMARLPAPVRWVARRLWEGEFPTFQKSEKAFWEALKRQPDFPYALEQMGETVEAGGRKEEARHWYRRALESSAQTPLDRTAQERARQRMTLISER